MNIFSSKYILLPPDFSAVPSFIWMGCSSYRYAPVGGSRH